LRYFVFSVDDVSIDPTHRSTYHMHMLGNHTALSVLDSDVIARWDTSQAQWLEGQWKSNTYDRVINRVAIYHCPLYPTVTPYDSSIPKNGRKYMLPIFDKYHLDVAFEQHDHVFKRSKLLYNNQVVNDVKNGTLYLGDGSWGIGSKGDVPGAWYLEKQSAINHVWVVDVNPTSIQSVAIDSKGKTFDSYLISK